MIQIPDARNQTPDLSWALEKGYEIHGVSYETRVARL